MSCYWGFSFVLLWNTWVGHKPSFSSFSWHKKGNGISFIPISLNDGFYGYLFRCEVVNRSGFSLSFFYFLFLNEEHGERWDSATSQPNSSLRRGTLSSSGTWEVAKSGKPVGSMYFLLVGSKHTTRSSLSYVITSCLYGVLTPLIQAKQLSLSDRKLRLMRSTREKGLREVDGYPCKEWPFPAEIKQQFCNIGIQIRIKMALWITRGKHGN